MALLTANNPWGISGGAEAQRSDLWLIDLQLAIQFFNSQSEELFNSLGLSRSFLLNVADAPFYAFNVMLPVQKIASLRIIQGTVPRNMPGYFEASDTARIDFRHEATSGEPSFLMTLLQIWRAFSRAGRQGGVDSEPLLPLNDETTKPTFKFDIGLQLLTGDDSSFDQQSMVLGPKYTLVDAWPRIIQQNQIDRAGNARSHSISVQFQVREVQ